MPDRIDLRFFPILSKFSGDSRKNFLKIWMKEPVKLVQLVKIAILFLHFMSKPFDLIILSSSK